MFKSFKKNTDALLDTLQRDAQMPFGMCVFGEIWFVIAVERNQTRSVLHMLYGSAMFILIGSKMK